MTQTTPIALLMGAVIGGVVGWAGQWILVATGNPALTPPMTCGVALAALGALTLALAWPIRSHVRAEKLRNGGRERERKEKMGKSDINEERKG